MLKGRRWTHNSSVVPPKPTRCSFILLCNRVRSSDIEVSSSDIIPISPEFVQNRWVGFNNPPSPSLDMEPGMNFEMSWCRPNIPSSCKVVEPLYWNENNARPSYLGMGEILQSSDGSTPP
jgi:hypothetical protein